MSDEKTQENHEMFKLLVSHETLRLNTKSIVNCTRIAIQNYWADVVDMCLSKEFIEHQNGRTNVLDKCSRLAVAQPANHKEENQVLELCKVLKKTHTLTLGHYFFGLENIYHITCILGRFKNQKSAKFKKIYKFFRDQLWHNFRYTKDDNFRDEYVEYCYEHLDAKLFASLFFRDFEKFLLFWDKRFDKLPLEKQRSFSLEVIDDAPNTHMEYFCFLCWLAASNEVEYLEYAVEAYSNTQNKSSEGYKKGEFFLNFCFNYKELKCSRIE